MSANGRLAAIELVAVDGVLLSRGTALAWKALAAAAQEAGIVLNIVKPYGGYRDMKAQEALYSGAVATNPNSTVKVSKPGTSSHGLGTRVDVSAASTAGLRKTWLLRNASRFGFYREFGDADPNHYAYLGGFQPAGTGYEPLGEDAMTAADVEGLHARFNNLEKILTGETVNGVEGGIRGALFYDIRLAQNIEGILATENGGGLRALLAALASKISAAPGSVDLSGVLAAVESIPTAEQNGIAARNAIVK